MVFGWGGCEERGCGGELLLRFWLGLMMGSGEGYMFDIGLESFLVAFEDIRESVSS